MVCSIIPAARSVTVATNSILLYTAAVRAAPNFKFAFVCFLHPVSSIYIIFFLHLLCLLYPLAKFLVYQVPDACTRTLLYMICVSFVYLRMASHISCVAFSYQVYTSKYVNFICSLTAFWHGICVRG